MNREYCIFKEKKECNNCGECERCDLNSNKKCNNCGKCLEKEGYDMKAIKIDEIIDNEGEAEEYNIEEKNNPSEMNSAENHYQLKKEKELVNDEPESVQDSYDSQDDVHDDYLNDYEYDKVTSLDELYEEDIEDENTEYIDDIEGLRELLEDEEGLSEVAYEEFPGFLRIKKGDKYNN